MTASGSVSRPYQRKEVRCCTKDEGRPLEAGGQTQASNRCKLLSLRAMVVSVAEIRDLISAGKMREGERKQTVAEASKTD